MKIFVLCNSDSLAIPTIAKLNNEGMLAGIGIPKRAQQQLLPQFSEMELSIKPTVLQRKDWVYTLKGIIQSEEIDTVWALTFPFIIPSDLLSLPRLGFVNFHFGLLPKYKGADPIFWQFKNGESHGGVTVHKMNEVIDEGPVLLQEKSPMMPGETYGLHCAKLGTSTSELIHRVKEIQENKDFESINLEAEGDVIEKKPDDQDLWIDWKKYSAVEVESLVNATNPKYGGAQTAMNGMPIRILEVTPVSISDPIEAESGQIIMADSTYGVIVACADMECVRITIAQTADGYFSGIKLFNMGFVQGHKFG